MQNDKKGTLLMLDSSLREGSPPATPRQGPIAPVQAARIERLGADQAPLEPSEAQSPASAAAVGDKPSKDPGARGHKKGKQAKHRAKVEADLSRISEALRELRGRLGDLHALQLDGEGRTAGLAARMDRLGADQTRTRELTGVLEARIDALGAKVEALRAEASVITDTLADLAVQPDRDTALFALEDRIQEAEDALVGLRALAEQQQMTEIRDALTERLDGLGRELGPLAERVAALEQGSADALGAAALAHLEERLGTLRGSLDDRLGAIERDLATLRDQNKRWREGERAWAEERLNAVRHGLVGGIALIALLVVAGLVATWWHGERQLDLVADRISTLEQQGGARLSAAAAPSGLADDRLGPALKELGAAMQGIQATHAELGAVETETMRDVLARLRALEERPTASPSAGVGADGGPGQAGDATAPQSEASGLAVGAGEPSEPRRSQAAGRGPAAAGQADLGSTAPLQVQPQVQARTEVGEPLVDGAPSPITGDLARAGSQAEIGVAAPSDGRDAESAAAAGAIPAEGQAQGEPAGGGPETQTSPASDVSTAAPATGSPQRYALQLIGFRSQGKLLAFAREQGLMGEARWIRQPGHGRDWYLVLLGDYGSRQDAQEALAALPPGLRALSPVVRTLPAEAAPIPAE